ncbi:MAG: hypothetical protein ACM3Q2_13230 [Syntrophothermus sp.]
MKKFFFFMFTSLALLSVRSSAQDYAVSVKAGTLGFQLEAWRSFGPSFNVHLGGSFFSYKYDQPKDTKEDYTLSADLKLSSFTLLADYLPFESSSFRLSTGIIYNNNKPNVVAVPTINKVIGGDVYNASNLGNMGVDLSFTKIAPYLGIGFGRAASGSGLGFLFDIGAFYQGPPKVKLSADGLLSPSASPEQAKIVENNLDWFKFYPVVSFGLSYKF